MPAYYSAKGALATMTMSLAKKMSGTGVRVNLISPGMILTDEVKDSLLKKAKNPARVRIGRASNRQQPNTSLPEKLRRERRLPPSWLFFAVTIHDLLMARTSSLTGGNWRS